MPKQTGVNYGADLLLRSVGDNPSQRQGPITGFNYDTVPRTRERPLVGAQDVRSYLEWLGQGGGLQNLNALGQGLFGPQGRQTVSDIARNVEGPVQPLGLGMGGPNEMMGQAMDFLNPMGKVGGLLGTLAGPTAKTANPVARNLAEQLKAQGRSDEDIWRLTAERHNQPWWLGHPDQVPRFEISDDLSKASVENLGWGATKDLEAGNTTLEPFSKVFTHEQVSQAYPKMFDPIRGLNTHIVPGLRGGELGGRTIKVGVNREGPVGQRSISFSPEQHSTMLHELQHSIQSREGMQPGGNPGTVSEVINQTKQSFNELANTHDAAREMATGKTLQEVVNDYRDIGMPLKFDADQRRRILGAASDPNQMRILERMRKQAEEEWMPLSKGGVTPLDPMEGYRRLGGEMDARAVQARQSLTQQERAARPFWMDYDRPLGQMIVRK